MGPLYIRPGSCGVNAVFNHPLINGFKIVPFEHRDYLKVVPVPLTVQFYFSFIPGF